MKNEVMRFIALTTDEPRKEIVRKLGLSPINHALFVHELTLFGHAHDWIVYRGFLVDLFGIGDGTSSNYRA